MQLTWLMRLHLQKLCTMQSNDMLVAHVCMAWRPEETQRPRHDAAVQETHGHGPAWPACLRPGSVHALPHAHDALQVT